MRKSHNASHHLVGLTRSLLPEGFGERMSLRGHHVQAAFRAFRRIDAQTAAAAAEQHLESAVRLAAGPCHVDDDLPNFLPRAGRLQRQHGGGMLHALKVRVELDDAAFKEGEAFENGVSAMHHVIVERHQKQAGVLADGPHAVLVEGGNAGRAAARQFHEFCRPCGSVENGNWHAIPPVFRLIRPD